MTRWLTGTAAGTELTRVGHTSEEDRPALQQQGVERLLDRLADPVSKVEHHHRVISRRRPQDRGVHRRTELDDPLAGQRNQAEGTEKRERRRDRDVRRSDKPGKGLEVSEDRIDLFS